jgi:hypothetical protein
VEVEQVRPVAIWGRFPRRRERAAIPGVVAVHTCPLVATLREEEEGICRVKHDR